MRMRVRVFELRREEWPVLVGETPKRQVEVRRDVARHLRLELPERADDVAAGVEIRVRRGAVAAEMAGVDEAIERQRAPLGEAVLASQVAAAGEWRLMTRQLRLGKSRSPHDQIRPRDDAGRRSPVLIEVPRGE